MKLKFLAGAGPEFYNIQGSVINGIDFSEFVEGSVFVGNEETQDVGIFGAEWIDGVLHVTLAQRTQTTQFAWGARETGWIDAEGYDPEGRYVQAINPHAVALIEKGEAEYKRLENGTWTVVYVENIEENINDE